MRLGVQAAFVGGQLLPGDVEIAGGRIGAVGLEPAGSGIAVPGFVDVQANGFAGVDFADADTDGYRRAGEALLATGVTAFRPTFITAPEEELAAALAAVPGVDIGPRILGAHVEGPFISPARLGAHPAAARRDPDAALMTRLLDAGPVAHVTLAPELPGALELVDLLVARGVVVACGHTDATAGEAEAAFARGARTVTHLFNAMRPLHHRDPGIAGAALTDPDVTVQLIADGTHLADEVVRLAFAAARGRVQLVTDAIAAATLGDGRYRLGGVEVDVLDGVARAPGGMLAGSVVTMDESVRRVHALGVPLEEVLAAASGHGSLVPGSPADVVVLNDALEVSRVLVGGRGSL
ncbi:MAG TPA: N-acetylglucosamine-6-phosphate deacetylase [Gaiellaceae bacterium]|nr:N-acetylglucosamine-6-phosphate deacetylase [Gaiellaceae bacterium]